MSKRRKTIIAGNWKMNLLASDCKPYITELLTLVPDYKKWCDVIACVPHTSLSAAVKAFSQTRVGVGAQNVSAYQAGAYTGEVSAPQISDVGAGYVIIGHSERRQFYGDTDELVNAKIRIALDNSLKPILCVGESLEQRERGVTGDVVSIQVKYALHGISEIEFKNIIIAYEPIWAIGTGVTATPDEAQETCAYIRTVIRSIYGIKASRNVSILYGGSMNENNANDLLAKPDIDGGLIGGASLKPESFAKIIRAAKIKQEINA